MVFRLPPLLASVAKSQQATMLVIAVQAVHSHLLAGVLDLILEWMLLLDMSTGALMCCAGELMQ